MTLCHIKPCILEKKFKALIYQMDLRIDLKKNPLRYLSTESILGVKRNVKGEGLEFRT